MKITNANFRIVPDSTNKGQRLIKLIFLFSSMFTSVGILVTFGSIVLNSGQTTLFNVTGAPPGGLLPRNLIGHAASLASHCFFAVALTVNSFFLILAFLAILFSIYYRLRHGQNVNKTRYLILVLMCCIIVSYFTPNGLRIVVDWLGSTTEWDGYFFGLTMLLVSINMWGVFPLMIWLTNKIVSHYGKIKSFQDIFFIFEDEEYIISGVNKMIFASTIMKVVTEPINWIIQITLVIVGISNVWSWLDWWMLPVIVLFLAAVSMVGKFAGSILTVVLSFYLLIGITFPISILYRVLPFSGTHPKEEIPKPAEV